jgi:hypothetical protein
LVLPLDGPALMLGDIMSIVLNTANPSSVLKKKNNSTAYNRVIEAFTARMMRFSYIKSEDNISD